MMDTKDKNIWKVATKYVEDLHGSEQPDDLWRDYWEIEGRILAQKVGK
tara:strand:- start:451 stop:594 length:144 start_codon:yes stop_codon:yes gene_type:complete